MGKLLVSLSLSIVLTLLSQLPSAQARSQCLLAFTVESNDPTNIGLLRSSFRHNSRYSNEIGDLTSIKNQCSLGTCHLYSWATFLERSYNQRTQNSLSLSLPYLAVKQWRSKALEVLNDPDPKEVKVSLGERSLQSREQIQKFGLIPESAWSPRFDFQRDPRASRIEEYITNRIARAKWDIERAASDEQKAAIRATAERDLERIFSSFGAEIPTEFEYNGRQYTPDTFAREFFPELFKPQIFAVIQNNRRASNSSAAMGEINLKVWTNLREIERMAKASIDLGQPVYLAYQHSSEFVDRKTGIMTIQGFVLPNSAGPLSRAQREHFSLNEGGHAVQLVGYDADPVTGEVIKWKIQNSWGEQAGENGIFHMYNDYFRAFARSITFEKTDRIPLPPMDQTQQ